MSRKIVVVGIPGSGKSTFSIKLGKILNTPVYHLDHYKFLKNGGKRDHNEFLAIESALLRKPAWIIEGCALSTLENRIKCATDIIYLDFPRTISLWRVFNRWRFFDALAKQSGCVRAVDWPLLKYIWMFKKERDPLIKKMLKKYPQVNAIRFQSSLHVNQFLKKPLFS